MTPDAVSPSAAPAPSDTPGPPPPAPRRRWSRRSRALVGLVALAGLAAGGWQYRVTRPDYRLRRGAEAVAAGDFKLAETLAARLEAAGRPDHAHLLRAESLYSRRLPDQALAECNRIRDEGAIRHRAAGLTGRCLLDLGALTEAGRAFDFVLSEDPNDLDAHRGMATVAYELGQSNLAAAHLEQVIRLDPADARPHRLMGEILREADDTRASLAEYREALRLKAGLSPRALDEIRFEVAMAHFGLSEYAQALAVLDEVEDAGTEDLAVQALRVDILRGLGRGAEAVALADRLVATKPEGAFYRLRGQLYLDAGDATAAVPLLESAVRLAPQHYQSRYLLAQAYAAAGRRADGERESERADVIRKDYELVNQLTRQAQVRPLDPGIRDQLAELTERLGDPKTAAQWRRAAAQLRARAH